MAVVAVVVVAVVVVDVVVVVVAVVAVAVVVVAVAVVVADVTQSTVLRMNRIWPTNHSSRRDQCGWLLMAMGNCYFLRLC